MGNMSGQNAAVRDEVSRNLPTLERFPIRWNPLIEKKSLRFKELEHVLIEKASPLLRNML